VARGAGEGEVRVRLVRCGRTVMIAVNSSAPTMSRSQVDVQREERGSTTQPFRCIATKLFTTFLLVAGLAVLRSAHQWSTGPSIVNEVLCWMLERRAATTAAAAEASLTRASEARCSSGGATATLERDQESCLTEVGTRLSRVELCRPRRGGARGELGGAAGSVSIALSQRTTNRACSYPGTIHVYVYTRCP
jgi:hypothetical protein